jgi:cytochrome c-type biogenesis protein CcmE
MKPKNQRLVLVAAAVVAALVAVLLAIWGLREKASYFYTPSEIKAGKAPEFKPIRLGGMVEKGSLGHDIDGAMTFMVEDGKAATHVRFHGILPDLFREGSGVVAEGKMVGDEFYADNILAKHDERYMPPELGNLAAEHKAGKTLEK